MSGATTWILRIAPAIFTLQARSAARASPKAPQRTISAQQPEKGMLDQHPLDAAAVRLRDVLGHPRFAEHVLRELDDDVIGGGARVVVEA